MIKADSIIIGNKKYYALAIECEICEWKLDVQAQEDVLKASKKLFLSLYDKHMEVNHPDER
jgi:hypothetical protein